LPAPSASGSNVLEQADVDGVVRLTAITPIMGPGGQTVYLSLGRAAAAVSGPVDTALVVGLAVTLALTLAAIWLATRWSQQAVERPIQAILAAATRLARGDLAARAAVDGQDSEVDDLASALNALGARLETMDLQWQQSGQRQQALEAQLFRSQARTTQLETVAAGLSQAGTAAEVMEVILRQGASALGAASATLLMLTENDRWLRRSAHAGRPDLIDMLFPRFPVSSPLPAADVVRTGEAMWIQSATEYRARYPQLTEVINSTDYEAAVALPLRVAGRLIGVIMLSFPVELAPGSETTAYLASLGSLCALGLERVGLKDLML
jgi:nitrate/nitrite-specific signal transduction histidine kinase